MSEVFVATAANSNCCLGAGTANAGPFKITTNLSVSAWVYFNSFTGFSNSQNICGMITNAFTDGFVLRCDTSSLPPDFKWFCYISGAYRQATGGTTLVINTWYHCGASYDGTTGIVYLNGVSDGTFTQAGTITYAATAQEFEIGNTGGNQANSNSPGNANIADVAVWNVTLTAGEFSALGRGARPKDIRPKSIVGYWPLDGFVQPEPDYSGNAFNGSVTTANGGTVTKSIFNPPLMLQTPRWPQFTDIPPPPPTISPTGFTWVEW